MSDMSGFVMLPGTERNGQVGYEVILGEVELVDGFAIVQTDFSRHVG